MLSLKPQETIVVFDIHGVLLTTDYLHILRLLHTKQTFTVLRYLCNPRVVWAMFKLARKGSIAEEYVVYLTSRYQQLAGCKDLLMAVANAQRPIKQTIALVYELKAQGYSLHILSNIGHLMYEQLYERFAPLFDQFDKVKVANAKENYLRKPDPAMYQLYLKQCNPASKLVIFIDDKQKNIAAAQHVGMIGLRFTKAHKLKGQFHALVAKLVTL